MKKTILCCLISFFLLVPLFSEVQKTESAPKAHQKTPTEQAKKNTAEKKTKKKKGQTRTITIHNANKTEREKNDRIHFRGSVHISIKDVEERSDIFADSIVYDKEKNTLFAEGSVRFIRGGEKPSEELRGSMFLFHIDDLSGAFLDGVVKHNAKRSGQEAFFVEGKIAGKDGSGVIAFKNARIGTDIGDDSLWSIKASRIWLLPGNEFAFANGYFSVGIVPILYLPFFYYPSDEMIMHPVFGMRSREGAFVQTTTYVLGRKAAPKKSSGSSFSNFFQGDSAMEQKRNGVFLQNLNTPAKNIPKDYVKLIGDMYSNLGGLVGVDGSFSSLQKYAISNLQFSLYFGFSKTVYKPSGGILYQPLYIGGNVDRNSSNFFGAVVPFRYSGNFSINVQKSPFRFSLDMPIVSDPFFSSDFFNRSEDMNWFSYLLNKGKTEERNTSKSNRYEWKLSSAISPRFSVVQPWINRISLSDLSAHLYFENRKNDTVNENSPEREFYAPNIFKATAKTDMSGTLFSTSMLKKRNKKKTNDFDALSNPFEPKKANTKTDSKEAEEKPEYFNDFLLPITIKTPSVKNNFSDIRYNLNYTVSGNFLDELTFNNKNINSFKDITWKEFSTHYYKISGSAGVQSQLHYAQNFLTLSNSLRFSSVYQRHGWVMPGTTSVSEEQLKLHNYKASVYSLKNENKITIRPLTMFPRFAESSLYWSMNEILVKNVFVGDVLHPKWNTEKVQWTKDTITSHNAGLSFATRIDSYTQRINFSANLPPQLNAYALSGAFTFPYGNFSIGTRYFEKEETISGVKKRSWHWDVLNMSLAWDLPYNIKMTQQYNYNIEEKESDRLNLTFSWKYISASFLMGRSIPQVLDPSVGWKNNGSKKKFMPLSLGFSVSNASKPFEWYFWKDRIHLNLSFDSTLQFNLLRITESYFTFAPKLTLKIHEFLDLSLRIYSRNDRIARYFQKAANLPVTLPGETSVLKDLLHSFYFWDKSKREDSGFKLKSVDFSLTHNLKDWTLDLTYSIKPNRKKNTAGKYYYDFSPNITFMVTWKPISDIKVKAEEKEREFTLTSGKLE